MTMTVPTAAVRYRDIDIVIVILIVIIVGRVIISNTNYKSKQIK